MTKVITSPTIAGEIRSAEDLGYKGWFKYIVVQCPDCGELRWSPIVRGEPRRVVCRSCSHKRLGAIGENSKNWRGGRVTHGNGYIDIFVYCDGFFAPMIHSCHRPAGGYVFEHRLVMARHLGRCLQTWEHVHHKNGIRDDNRIENLEIVMNGNHMGTIKCPHCGRGFKLR